MGHGQFADLGGGICKKEGVVFLKGVDTTIHYGVHSNKVIYTTISSLRSKITKVTAPNSAHCPNLVNLVTQTIHSDQQI